MDGVSVRYKPETYRALSLDKASPQKVEAVVNEESQQVTVERRVSDSGRPSPDSNLLVPSPENIKLTNGTMPCSLDVSIGETTKRAESARPSAAITPQICARRFSRQRSEVAKPDDPTFAGACCR